MRLNEENQARWVNAKCFNFELYLHLFIGRVAAQTCIGPFWHFTLIRFTQHWITLLWVDKILIDYTLFDLFGEIGGLVEFFYEVISV